jgi:hypothetical protein
MSFVGKWMELKIIVSSKVSQVQKVNVCMFSLTYGRQIQKISIYTITNMSYIYVCIYIYTIIIAII